MWTSSPSMHGYPLAPYFGPWYGSLCYGWLPNYFAYQWSRAKYLFRLCTLLWMNSYSQYFYITLSVKYSRWVFATIVLLESSHRIHFCGFQVRGAWYTYLDLLHGCDNLINLLTNKAKVLAWSLFLTMVLFETSSRLKLHLHKNSSQMWIFRIRLGYIVIHEVWHVEAYGDSLLEVQQVAEMKIKRATC